MNVLFLAGGRRVSLAERFIDAGFKIFSYELTDKVPISSVAKIIIGKPWDTSEGVEKAIKQILTIIIEENIKLIIPLQDKATTFKTLLASSGACYLAPASYIAENCYDKQLFGHFMQSYFMDIYPFVDLTVELTSQFPILAKPKFGFGSRGIIKINNRTECYNHLYLEQPENYTLQRFIEGQEYSVDCYFNWLGTFIDCVPRKRLRTAGGEVITSITEKNELLRDLAKKVGEQLNLVGPVNMQFIIEKETNYPYLIEINCRFGGGCTLSMEAGLDIISLIKRDYFLEKFNYTPWEWKDGLLMERAYRDFYYG